VSLPAATRRTWRAHHPDDHGGPTRLGRRIGRSGSDRVRSEAAAMRQAAGESTLWSARREGRSTRRRETTSDSTSSTSLSAAAIHTGSAVAVIRTGRAETTGTGQIGMLEAELFGQAPRLQRRFIETLRHGTYRSGTQMAAEGPRRRCFKVPWGLLSRRIICRALRASTAIWLMPFSRRPAVRRTA